jgi:hypothetical protein
MNLEKMKKMAKNKMNKTNKNRSFNLHQDFGRILVAIKKNR